MAYREIQFLAVLLAVFTPASYARSAKKLLNGEDTTIHEFPYHIFMIRDTIREQGSCGGTIIDQQHILTAAHCFYDGNTLTPAANMLVVTAIDNVNHASRENYYGVLKAIPHPDYMKSSGKYADIGILKLQRRISFDARQTSGLFLERNIASGAKVIFIGMAPQADESMVLKKMNATVLSLTECRAWYPQRGIRSTHLCAFSTTGAAPCYGDSGSPLISNGKVVGILSQGLCDGNEAVIFTNVYKYLPWIRNNI